jgi:hypothetical protein
VGAGTQNQLSPSRNTSPELKADSSAKAEPARANLSDVARASSQGEVSKTEVDADASKTPALIGGSDESKEKANSGEGEPKQSSAELSEGEREQVEALKLRDREVRAHEQAHKSVGGQYAGSISLSYQSGPDGQRYAVGGEVPIDVSPIQGDPQATIAKMNIVKAAATAPAEPSSQDAQVAAQASRLISDAQSELAAQSRVESKPEEKVEDENKSSSAAARFEEVAGLSGDEETEIDTVV